MLSIRTARAAARAARTGAGALAAAAALAGCSVDRLVTVNTPDVATTQSISNASALPAVYAAAIAEFTVAFQGSGGGAGGGSTNNGSLEGQILYGGLVSDEILLSDTFSTRRQIDSRNIGLDLFNASNDAVYRELQIARVAAERAAAGYRQYQNFTAQQAEAYALAGYTYIFFAEHYCGGVPFSTLNPDGTTVNGGPNTTQQILAIASAKFDSALAITDSLTRAKVTVTTQLNLARVGKARALLDLGQYAAAAALVNGTAPYATAVPTTFSYSLASSTNTPRQNNGVWSFNRSQRRFTVTDKEGANGLPYISDKDPRVLLAVGSSTSLTVGFDNATPLYTIVKYSEQASSAVLVNGVEARLIEAEAAYNAGNVAGMYSILNTMRANTALYPCPAVITLNNFTCPATTPQLAALTPAATQLGQLKDLFKERAYWLFATGHRLGDLRRLSRTPTAGLSAYGNLAGGPNANFPIGAYTVQAGTTYGTTVNLTVPASEATVNPLFQQSACNITAP